MAECLFMGSFNPIHNAHLQAADYVYKNCEFKKIIFIPAYNPPHKNLECYGAENALHRLEMVQAAIEDYSYFDVSAVEYMRSGYSYTYDTVSQICSIIMPEEKINIIIGTDAFIKIESWYKTEELKKLADFILFVREDNFDEKPFEKLREKGYNYKLMQMPFLDISSEEIRRRCAEGLSIDDLVPEKVSRYIKEHGLYKIQH